MYYVDIFSLTKLGRTAASARIKTLAVIRAFLLVRAYVLRPANTKTSLMDQ